MPVRAVAEVVLPENNGVRHACDVVGETSVALLAGCVPAVFTLGRGSGNVPPSLPPGRERLGPGGGPGGPAEDLAPSVTDRPGGHASAVRDNADRSGGVVHDLVGDGTDVHTGRCAPDTTADNDARSVVGGMDKVAPGAAEPRVLGHLGVRVLLPPGP